jgi:hypothetical protein
MRTTKTTTRPTVGTNLQHQLLMRGLTRDANLVKKRQSGPTSFKEKMTNERYTPSKRTPSTKAKPTSVGGTKAQRNPSNLQNLRGRIK